MTAAKYPTAGLLIVGNEILNGRTADENGPFLLKALRQRGIEVVELRVVPDSEPAIVQAITHLRHRCDRVLVTGGIGPTHDDVTVRALAHAFAKPVVVHAELASRVRAYFGQGAPKASGRLAEVPEGAEVLLDAVAMVPIITLGNVTLLPGVPSFVRSCFAEAIGDLSGPPFVAREVCTEASESDIAAPLAALQAEYEDLAMGSYPAFGHTKTTVTLRIEGRDAGRVQAAMTALRASLPPPRAKRSTR